MHFFVFSVLLYSRERIDTEINLAVSSSMLAIHGQNFHKNLHLLLDEGRFALEGALGHKLGVYLSSHHGEDNWQDTAGTDQVEPHPSWSSRGPE